jgi:hypothetical protein
MDPLNVIVTAVVTGAALGLKSTTEQALQDAYAGLKKLILDRYGDRGDVASALESVEGKPESEGRQAVLEEELEQTAVAEDEEILGAAQALLETAHVWRAEAGPSQVTASDHSVAVGGGAEGNVITIHGDGNVVGDGSESDVRKS